MKDKSFEQYKRIFLFSEIVLTLDAMCGLFGWLWYSYLNTLNEKPFTGSGNLMEIVVYVIATLVFIQIFGGFEIGFYTALNAILSQVLAMFCVNFLMAVQTILTISSIYTLDEIFLAFFILQVAQVVAAIILVQCFDHLYVWLFPAWDILLVYENDSVRLFMDKVNTRKDKYVIGDTINVSEGVEAICDKIRKHDSVIIYDVSSALRNDLIKFCYGEGIRVYQTPKISDILIRSAKEHHLFDTPLLMSNNIGLTFEQKVVKRLIDIVVSFLMLIITAPIMLITAICIIIEDHGPVFFIQERITLHDRPFMIYKFRSMIVDAEADGKARPAVADDDRITKVGRIIRKTRIDELPQLYNVLKGDMSLVGPRPERVEHVIKYTEKIPEFQYRTKVKGGLTGYAQVYGKYNTTAYDKIKLDLMYIENYSLVLDFRIVVMTIKVIFMKSSTEGFANNNLPGEEQMKAENGEDS
ncbi:MAG TPA: sugar transferase [Lachnospiraceae bacterium]|nr:sugar transferase [Lachnospiraceae bacterium]HPF29078.1 sugar transferase [Lachnospiraceae bacterium]